MKFNQSTSISFCQIGQIPNNILSILSWQQDDTVFEGINDSGLLGPDRIPPQTPS